MRTIWKYEIPFPVDHFERIMPMPGRVVRVGMQNGRPHMWCEVDDNTELADRIFLVRGTGHPIPDDACWLGTWKDGGFVWHLFDAARPFCPSHEERITLSRRQ